MRKKPDHEARNATSFHILAQSAEKLLRFI